MCVCVCVCVCVSHRPLYSVSAQVDLLHDLKVSALSHAHIHTLAQTPVGIGVRGVNGVTGGEFAVSGVWPRAGLERAVDCFRLNAKSV